MENSTILLSGAGGMLGRYISARARAAGHRIIPLSLADGFMVPTLPERPDVAIHCAGSEDDAALNDRLGRGFLDAVAAVAPKAVLLVSSWQVYSADAGEGVDETRPLWASTEVGRSKARMEKEFGDAARMAGIPLAVVRPARMFGSGVGGEMRRLFDRVVAGKYLHIRENDARLSLVTAHDCAAAVLALAGRSGVYNVSDGRGHRWVDLCEAMSANAGEFKRMPRIPARWATVIKKLFPRLPIVKVMLSDEALKPVSTSLTLDTSRLGSAINMEFHDTLEVIARRDKSYPYEN